METVNYINKKQALIKAILCQKNNSNKR